MIRRTEHGERRLFRFSIPNLIIPLCLFKSGHPAGYGRLACGTKDFPIQREYWEYIFRHLSLDGYLEGVMIIPMAGGCPDRVKIGQLQITPKGIAYLQENTMMQKAKDFLKEIKEIVPGL